MATALPSIFFFAECSEALRIFFAISHHRLHVLAQKRGADLMLEFIQ